MSKPYQEWCANHAWAVTTEAECNGYPPPDDPRYPTTYALYDAAEDDPPIALFEFREDAERVAAILNEYGRDDEAVHQVRRGLPSDQRHGQE